MPSTKFTTEMEGRPTLPSIHTLDLFSHSSPRNVKYDTHNNLRQNNAGLVHHHSRQFSSSSSQTSASRRTSPSPSYNSDSESDGDLSSPRGSQCPTKLRLAPCAIEQAEAIIVVSDAPIGAQGSDYAPRQGKHSVLLMGPSIQRFRNPQRTLAKGVRVHPYRVVRNNQTSDLRRPSLISITAFSNTQ
ncbi:hypothetical protein CVT26_003834 [Gymnopilus dilepis]|uniref:Uncharacterized protein n=1 Tax=Gymnopilus dilepis TaxID=231916 RepID=A0A409YV16_9AGAR|nr:hypothetical protein CVT26_003834 [Gymnopilus dilepis]